MGREQGESRTGVADLVLDEPRAETDEVQPAAARAGAFLAAVLLVVLGAWVSPTKAFACECAGISAGRALRQADAVFRGTLVDSTDVGRGAGARSDLRFRVDTVYKGTAYTEQVVATTRDKQDCGLHPRLNSTWVVFATEGVRGRGDEAVSRLVTSVCSGNLPNGTAPAQLGPGRPPVEGRSDREEVAVNADRALTRWLGRLGVATLVVVVLGGVGLAFVWRTGGRSPAA